MKDLIQEKGTLALASRLKRLSERLMQDGSRIYQTAGVDFKPAWFPIFLTLLRDTPLPVGHIAEQLGVSHVAINSTLKELTERGYVKTASPSADKRVRLVELTEEGQNAAAQASKVWPALQTAIDGAIAESNHDILRAMNALEKALDRQSFFARFQEQWNEGLEIVPYESIYRSKFAEINLAWIEQYFVAEAPDRRVLEHPEEEILAKDGAIYFARDQISGEIVGTCALIRHGNEFELAKMGVIEQERGRGAGHKLGLAVVNHAKRMGLKQIYLETNSMLQPAISLYKKLGFVHLPHPHPSEYNRADVYMLLEF